MDSLEGIRAGLIAGQPQEVSGSVRAAIEAGVGAESIMAEGLIRGMRVVGDRFKVNEMYLPEVMASAQAMRAGLDLLEPLLAAQKVKPVAQAVIGTVQGDVHDLGKQLMGAMLRGAGFQVMDLGIDVPPQKFVEAARSRGAALVGLSALLSTTMPEMKVVIDEFVKQGLRSKVKIMVGGAPVTQEFANQIGADGYAPNAASAVEKALALVGGGSCGEAG